MFAVFVVAASASVWRAVTRDPGRLAHRFARSMDLPLPNDLIPAIGRRLRIQLAARLAVVCALGIACIALIQLAWDRPHGMLFGAALGLPAFGSVLYVPVAELVAYLVDRATSARWLRSTRVARVVRPRTDDFVAPWMTWFARAAAVVPVLVWAALSDHHAGAFAVAAAPIVVCAAVELGQRRLAGGRQRAATGLELAYDDAFRAVTMIGLVGLSLGVAAAATVAVTYGIRTHLAETVAVGTVGAVLLWRIVTLIPDFSRRFRHRLSAVS